MAGLRSHRTAVAGTYSTSQVRENACRHNQNEADDMCQIESYDKFQNPGLGIYVHKRYECV